MTHENTAGKRLVPDHSGLRRNAGVVCDMYVGPCACGATHNEPTEADRAFAKAVSDYNRSIRSYKDLGWG